MSAVATDKLSQLLQVIIAAIAKSPNSGPPFIHTPNQAQLTFQVDPTDQGRFIGKNGSTIWAIQTLFWFAGLTQCGYSYYAKLLEPRNPIRNRPPSPFKFNPKWDRQKIQNLVDTITSTCLPSHCSYSMHEIDETTSVVKLRLEKYLERQLSDPNFAEAVETVLRVAGMSQGAAVKTEAVFS